jgi:hypothetical protein
VVPGRSGDGDGDGGGGDRGGGGVVPMMEKEWDGTVPGCGDEGWADSMVPGRGDSVEVVGVDSAASKRAWEILAP